MSDSSSSPDPKSEASKCKTPLQLLPPVFMASTAKALAVGAKKYGPWNWRKNRIDAMTYVGAIRRHLDAWVEGEDMDGESGESHLAHIAATTAVMLDAISKNMLDNDRPA